MLLFLVFLFLNILFVIRGQQQCLQSIFRYLDLGLSMIQVDKHTNPQQNQLEQIREKIKLRNLAIKLAFGHIDKTINNLNQSFRITIEMMTKQIQDQEAVVNKQQQMNDIKTQLQIFIEELRRLPKLWLNFIHQNKLQKQGNKIIMNKTITITQIYQILIQSINTRVIQSKQHKVTSNKQRAFKILTTNFDFQRLYFDQSSINMFSMILNCFAQQICICFQEGKTFLNQQTKIVQQLIKKSKIMNTYVLFALLKQMSKTTYQRIKQIFQSVFPNIPSDITNEFCRFVQANYEIVNLHYRQSEDHKIFSELEKKNYYYNENMKLIAYICKDKIDGIKLLFQSSEVENEQAKTIANQLMTQCLQNAQKMSEIKAQKTKWKIVDIKDSFKQFFGLLKNNIEGEITASADQQIANDLLILQPGAATIGGGIGKCLVDIDEYSSVNAFFVDLSKNAMIGGSLGIMLEEVPILNYFIIAGGLSYTVYVNYKDEITSSLRKMKQVGKASVVAVGSVGSTVTGMIVGQIMIPIPFVGAFIGGIIGGYFGQKGSRTFTSILTNHELMKLINYLHETIVQDSHWQYNDKLREKLGISQKYFQTSFSTKVQSSDAYITALCFCVVAYYESRKHTENTQKRIIQSDKNKQIKKQTSKQEGHKIKKQQLVIQNFENNKFDVVMIIEYLTSHHIMLVDELQILEKSVMHIIT